MYLHHVTLLGVVHSLYTYFCLPDSLQRAYSLDLAGLHGS